MPSENNLPHIVLSGPSDFKEFTSAAQMGGQKRIPQRDRTAHSNYLRRRLTQAWEDSESAFIASHSERKGVYLEFRGKPGYELVTKSLENMRSRQKIRLCNVRTEQEIVQDEISGLTENKEVVYATVYVPNEKRQHFFNTIQKYATEDSSRSGKPKNADLVNGIEDLQRALVRSFWQDLPELIPNDDREWCEVWLSGDFEAADSRFTSLVAELGIPIKNGQIRFPERTVKLIHATKDELELILNKSDDIAEFRRAKETADFWVEQSPHEQAEWAEDLSYRLNADRESLTSICILDTGVNSGHPLLSPLLSSEDCHSVDPSWGTHDHDGHGTLMAGLAAYGDIQSCLEGDGEFNINHVLESAKILPPPPGENDSELWGFVTSQGINRAEIQAPDRKRVICMAVAAHDSRDQGRPSSWSAAIDQITSGAEDDTQRLLLISAGNFTSSIQNISVYPDFQITDSIHDPAQSWNALSIGAFTNLTTLTDSDLNGFTPIAGVGELSPFSTTSFTWEDKWPIKPDVVFEGGNAAVDSTGFVTDCNDLSLVSTHFRPQESLFESFKMTSAATSQAAYFAANIQSEYPDYWPETIRALVVHSAEWPDGLKEQFANNESKSEIGKLLKACGYGVPNLQRALYCVRNELTMTCQSTIQPFVERLENGSKKRKTKDMHFYNLPWPSQVLERLGEVEVEMRITLSYFVEPGPGEIGWKDRYRYPSHLLRFRVNSPGESEEEFLRRINVAMRDEENGHPGTSSGSEHWVIGKQRDKGSVHSDIWRGTAVELSAVNLLAVTPSIGWWRERHHLGKVNSETRYALVVSIRTPEQDVDIYTPVLNQVHLPVSIPVMN